MPGCLLFSPLSPTLLHSPPMPSLVPPLSGAARSRSYGSKTPPNPQTLANLLYMDTPSPFWASLAFPYLPAASLLEISASLPRIWRCQPAAATWRHPIGHPSPQKPPSPTPRSPPVPRAPRAARPVPGPPKPIWARLQLARAQAPLPLVPEPGRSGSARSSLDLLPFASPDPMPPRRTLPEV